MIRLMFSLVLAGATAATSTMAMARNRHQDPAETHRVDGYLHNPANDPNAVFVGGTYAGSDPDPNIRAALAREFGRQKF